MLANNRQSWKGVSGSNTLACLSEVSVIMEKKFYDIDYRVSFIKLFFFITDTPEK
jgi:hypothetical protein